MKLEHLHQLCKEADLSKRLIVYQSIEKDNGLEFLKNAKCSDNLLDKHLASFFERILMDVIDDENEDSLLTILNIVISFQLFNDSSKEYGIDDEVTIKFLKKLIKILCTSKSAVIKQKIFKVMSLQCFHQSALNEVVGSLLPAIATSKNSLDGSVIAMIHKFMKQCPELMYLHTQVLSWLKVFLGLTCHSDVSVRSKAVAALKQYLPIILKNKEKIIATCASFLKEEVLPNLNSLNGKEDILHEILSLQLPIFMSIIGEDYKRSSRLSNSLLKFVEKGFCHSEEKIKLSAFNAWQCLIECFAGNKDLLASTKYFKLFSQPLRIKLRSEEISKALVETMWKLAQRLDDHLPNLFEMLCVPLFGICFKGNTGVIQQRRSSGRLSFTKQQSPYKIVQIYGAEMLFHLLLPRSTQNYQFHLGALREPFFGASSVFARFYSYLIPAVRDMINQLHQELPSEFLLDIWNQALKCVQDLVTRKRDVEIFRSLFQAVFGIVNVDIRSDLLLSIVSSLTIFPNKILNSSLHYQSESPEASMHGTPVLTILRLLLSSNVRRDNVENPKFLQCAQSIISCGMERQIGNLEFIRSVVNQLSASDVVFLKIWKFLADETIVYLEKTGNVNDGDSLEHDFSSLYQTLLFPFQFVFDSKSELEELFMTSANKTWASLFQIFAKHSCEIANIKPNEVRQHIATQFLSRLKSCKFELSSTKFLFVEMVLFEILNGADYSNEQTSKSTKSHRKKKPVETSLMTGFNLTAEKLLNAMETKFVDTSRSFPPFNVLPSIEIVITSVPQPLVAPFFHLISSFLFEYLVEISLLNDYQVEKLEKTWSQILFRLEYFEALFGDEYISQIFALTFSDSRFCKSTLEFWKTKVPEDFDVLNLPEILRDAISSACKKQECDNIVDKPIMDEKLNLNMSAVSEPSGNVYDEVDISSSFVDESDVSMHSTDVEDTNDDISDVSLENVTNDCSQKEHDGIVSDVTQEENGDTSRDVTRDHEDISDVTEDEEFTQLEKAYISSDEDVEVVNRSLNLRSLANTHSKSANTLATQTSKMELRKSPRFAVPKLTETCLSSESMDVTSSQVASEESQSTIETEDEESNVTETLTDSKVSETSVGVVMEEKGEVKETTNADPFISRSSDEPENILNERCRTDESIPEEESFDTCKDAASGSLYEEVEMAQASMNVSMNDDAINSSLDPETSSHGCQKTSKEIVAEKEATNTELIEISSDDDISNSNISEEGQEVEMAEMSTAPDPSVLDSSNNRETKKFFKELNYGDDILSNESNNLDGNMPQAVEPPLDSDVLEERTAGACEKSVQTVHVQSFISDLDSKKPEESQENEDENSSPASSQKTDKLPEDQDTEEYEYVEMAETSVYFEPHQESNKNDSENSSSREISTSIEDAATEKPDKENTSHLTCSDTSSAYEYVEMNEMSINPDVSVASPSDETEGDLSTSSSSSPQTVTESRKDPQNVDDDHSNKACEIETEIIQNSQLSNASATQTSIKIQSKFLRSADKSDSNMRVLNDESFNAFVRDLEVVPLNSSFETCENEASKQNEKESQPISNSNNDVIEGSEPLRAAKHPRIRPCEVQVRILPELKNSTPKRSKLALKSRHRKHIRQCKKKDLNPVLPNDCVSLEPCQDVDDVIQTDDVIGTDDVSVNRLPLDGKDEHSIERCVDDVNKSNSNDNDDVIVVMETSSPQQQQNISVLKSATESPPASERKDDDIETPKSCLGKRLTCIRESSNPSPSGSPCGILKKRISDVPSPAFKTRRVSFAEPISTSTVCPPSDNGYRSPQTSPRHFKKPRSPRPPSRLVSRRLSLPAPWSNQPKISSPMSARSIQIAAAIANIKARNGDTNHSSTSSKSPDFDVTSLTLSQINDESFLRLLNEQQLHQIIDYLLKSNPINGVYSLLISKLQES